MASSIDSGSTRLSPQPPRPWRPADTLLLLCILGLGGLACLGFFFPDPHSLEARRAGLLWALRLTGPVLALAAAFVYILVRRGKLPLSGVLLALGAGLAMILVLSPVFSHFYYKSLLKKPEGYHPFLQLDPPLAKDCNKDGKAAPFTVFCLGGSTTEFKDQNGKGWPERVEELLSASLPGRGVKVVNLGRQWYTSQHSLTNFLQNLRHCRPDLVLVMHAINDLLVNADFSRFSLGPFREDYGHFTGPVSGLVDRVPLATRMGRLLGELWFASGRYEPVTTGDFPGLIPFKRNLRALAGAARAGGAQVVFLTQPHLLKEKMTPEEEKACYMINYEAVGRGRRWTVETGRLGLEAYAAATREIARETSAGLIDLVPLVPKDLAHFSDEVHYQGESFDIIARAVAAGLQKRLGPGGG